MKIPVAGRFEDGHQRIGLLTDHGERDAEQDRDEQYLKDIVPIGHGRNQRTGDDVHQEAGQRPVMRLLLILDDLPGVQRRRIDIEARTRMHHIGDDQADDQRQRRKGQEIGEGLGRHPADRAQFLHPRHPGDDGEEDDGRDDHLDQLDKGLSQRLKRYARCRKEVTNPDAQRDGDQHLNVKLAIEWRWRQGLIRRRRRWQHDVWRPLFAPHHMACRAPVQKNSGTAQFPACATCHPPLLAHSTVGV